MIHLAAMLTTVEAHREAAARPPAHIVVRSGDSLSGIAARYRIEWPGLYEANKGVIGSNPNVINVGEQLRIPSPATAAHLASLYRPPAVSVTVPTAVPAAVTAAPTAATAAPTAVTAAPAPAAVAAAPAAAPVSAPAGSFQQCVISRESGGNPQVMNSSGHYGLYQFSYSSWVGAGGSPATFGHASVGEQNQVFNQAYAQSGTAPWAPYDGC